MSGLAQLYSVRLGMEVAWSSGRVLDLGWKWLGSVVEC